jgi:hypothetical protein
MTPSSMPTSPIAPALTSSTTRVECAHLKGSLLCQYGKLLDRWHLESIPCNKLSGVLGRVLHKAQSCHLSHDGGLNSKSWLIAAATTALIVKLYPLLVIPLVSAAIAVVPVAVTAVV